MFGQMKFSKGMSRSQAGQKLRAAALPWLLAALFMLGIVFCIQIGAVWAAGILDIEIIAGYNLIVDSNVKSPSTYAPRAATVIGEFCNTGATPFTNVYGYIGDYVDGSSDTPGVYPIRDSSSDAEFQAGQQWNYLYNTGDYFFRHIGGTTDATRFIGDIAPGECKYLYWSFEYPACENVGGAWAEPPCVNDPLWGTSVKPEDDFSLKFDIWSTSDQGSEDATWTMTMRNEISAMANKIKPNPDGLWFNTDTSTVRVGEVITTNGVNYELGNIRHGFDNDGDYAPDFNAWMQPISRPSFDPSCFRLIRTTGTLTVSRSAKPDMIIPFADQLYFTNLPPDNNGVRGVVYYTFLALDGPCNVGLSPYQEVASGFDNEKFNGDYGAGIPPVVSLEPELTLDKSSAPDTIAAGSTTTYTIPFANTGDGELGLTLSSGYGVTMPLVISDTVPVGMNYVGSSATYHLDFTPNNGVTVRFSTDGGATWGTTDPDTTLSSVGSEVILQWWLNDPLPAKTTPNNTSSGYAQFRAAVPFSGYTGPSFIENEACAGLGDADPFMCATAITMIEGANSIGDFVWRDEDNDGVQDGGDETGINGVTVSLYWDQNGDGALDDGDVLLNTQDTSGGGAYDFTQLPQGDYIVTVDETDPDLPEGYNYTTAKTIAVSITADSTDYNDADFGFGPILDLTKTLVNGEFDEVNYDNLYEGQLAAFNLNVINNRPGGTGPSNACQYSVWTGSSVGPGPDNSDWVNMTAIVGYPDNSYATAVMSNNSQNVVLADYFTGARAENITNVSYVMYVREAVDLGANDTLDVLIGDTADDDLYYSSITAGDPFNAAYFNQPLGEVYELTIDLGTTLDWAEFASTATNPLQVDITGDPGAGDSGTLEMDAAYFIITTDEVCGDLADTLDPVPVTDTYNPTQLEFVSANPPVSVQASGTLTWNNVGPLEAGEVQPIEVIFKVLQPTTSGDVITNTATITNAKYLNGRDTNDVSDDANAEVYTAYTIGDYVWFDADGAGDQNTDEPGLAGVVVELYLTSNTTIFYNGQTYEQNDLIITTTTDANGGYLFEGIPSSGSDDYEVQVNEANSPVLTGLSLTGGTDPYVITNLISNILTADFGYSGGSIVYGSVWHDADADAVGPTVDTEESYIFGVTVKLCTDAAGTSCVATTTTDENGRYQFTNVSDGTYYVVVSPPGTQVAEPTGEDTTQTCGTCNNAFQLTVNSGTDTVYGGYNFGYTGADIGDTLYIDWDGDGIEETGEEGIPNVDVYLYLDLDGDGVVDAEDTRLETTTTDGNGNYLFTDYPAGSYLVTVDTGDPDFPASYLPAGDPDATLDNRHAFTTDGTTNKLDVDFGYQPIGSGSIGDFVWQDDDGDGVQDAGETGIANITVRLYEDQNGDGVYNASVDALIITTTTGTDGDYLFENLPAGDYLVDVDTGDSDLPTDDYSNLYTLSTNNDPLTVTLTTAQNYLDADFGFTTGGIIGNYVWEDWDSDGNQDDDEPGINGVTLNLYNCGANGTCEDGGGDDVLVATQTTANDTNGNPGYYEFTGLPANDYVVVVTDTGGVLSGYTQTSDPDETGACTTCDGLSTLENQPAPVASPPTPPPGLQAGQIDRSRDFGYRPPGVLGDTLWIDADGDGIVDLGEPPVAYVTVNLYDSSNNLVAATETDSDGQYSFGNLPADTYRVAVDASDADYIALNIAPTYDLDGGNDNQASVALASGGANYDVDFGYQLDGSGSISGHVFFDAGGATPDSVTGDIYASGMDSPYGDITVYLWNELGQLVGVTTTLASDGSFTFGKLPVSASEPTTYTVSVNQNGRPLEGLELTATPNFTPTLAYNTVYLTTPSPTVTNQDFGFYADLDFGDLLDSYNTLLASEGPNHVRSTLVLGILSDAEGDGQPDNDAGVYDGGGDDGSNSDEDGVSRVMSNNWTADTDVGLQITVTNGPGRVVGWFDWDNNGYFDEMRDFGELSGNSQPVTVHTPVTYTTGTPVNARFRLFDPDALPGGSLDYGDYLGAATGGEVEDYQWKFGPTAVGLTSFTASASRGSLTLLIAFMALVMTGIVILSATVLRRRYKH